MKNLRLEASQIPANRRRAWLTTRRRRRHRRRSISLKRLRICERWWRLLLRTTCPLRTTYITRNPKPPARQRHARGANRDGRTLFQQRPVRSHSCGGGGMHAERKGQGPKLRPPSFFSRAPQRPVPAPPMTSEGVLLRPSNPSPLFCTRNVVVRPDFRRRRSERAIYGGLYRSPIYVSGFAGGDTRHRRRETSYPAALSRFPSPLGNCESALPPRGLKRKVTETGPLSRRRQSRRMRNRRSYCLFHVWRWLQRRQWR